MRAIPSALFRTLILSALVVVLAAQAPDPVEEFVCEHVTPVKAHRCDCPGMQRDPMCKTPPNPDDPEPSYEESVKCLHHCRKDLCRCLRACDT